MIIFLTLALALIIGYTTHVITFKSLRWGKRTNNEHLVKGILFFTIAILLMMIVALIAYATDTNTSSVPINLNDYS